MRTQLLLVIVFYLVAAALTVNFFHNAAALRELRSQQVALQEDIAALEKVGSQLQEQVKSLKEDPYYIERAAREELGWTRSGDSAFPPALTRPVHDRGGPARHRGGSGRSNADADG